MTNWPIRFYINTRGDALVQDFVLTQSASVIAKFNRISELIEAKGPDLGMPLTRNLGGNLHELRIRDKNEVRIFYIALYSPNRVVMLHAFKKRTQKIPGKELKIARKRQKDLT